MSEQPYEEFTRILREVEEESRELTAEEMRSKLRREFGIVLRGLALFLSHPFIGPECLDVLRSDPEARANAEQVARLLDEMVALTRSAPEGRESSRKPEGGS